MQCRYILIQSVMHSHVGRHGLQSTMHPCAVITISRTQSCKHTLKHGGKHSSMKSCSQSWRYTLIHRACSQPCRRTLDHVASCSHSFLYITTGIFYVSGVAQWSSSHVKALALPRLVFLASPSPGYVFAARSLPFLLGSSWALSRSER